MSPVREMTLLFPILRVNRTDSRRNDEASVHVWRPCGSVGSTLFYCEPLYQQTQLPYARHTASHVGAHYINKNVGHQSSEGAKMLLLTLTTWFAYCKILYVFERYPQHQQQQQKQKPQQQQPHPATASASASTATIALQKYKQPVWQKISLTNQQFPSGIAIE